VFMTVPGIVMAQSSPFTYQGKLIDGGSQANGQEKDCLQAVCRRRFLQVNTPNLYRFRKE